MRLSWSANARKTSKVHKRMDSVTMKAAALKVEPIIRWRQINKDGKTADSAPLRTLPRSMAETAIATPGTVGKCPFRFIEVPKRVVLTAMTIGKNDAKFVTRRMQLSGHTGPKQESRTSASRCGTEFKVGLEQTIQAYAGTARA